MRRIGWLGSLLSVMISFALVGCGGGGGGSTPNTGGGASSTYSVSGIITANSVALAGVTLTAGSTSATTDASGNYTISSLANGTYTVTPTKNGYTFNPATMSVTVNSANVTGKNFTASSVSTRFIDNGNGTIYDSVRNQTWLKNANCFSEQTWSNAITLANSLANGQCGLSDGSRAGDWHLPTVDELNAGYRYNDLNTAGFLNYQDYYWSSTSYQYDPRIAWVIGMQAGYIGGSIKTDVKYVWPVRTGQ